MQTTVGVNNGEIFFPYCIICCYCCCCLLLQNGKGKKFYGRNKVPLYIFSMKNLCFLFYLVVHNLWGYRIYIKWSVSLCVVINGVEEILQRFLNVCFLRAVVVLWVLRKCIDKYFEKGIKKESFNGIFGYQFLIQFNFLFLHYISIYVKTTMVVEFKWSKRILE